MNDYDLKNDKCFVEIQSKSPELYADITSVWV